MLDLDLDLGESDMDAPKCFHSEDDESDVTDTRDNDDDEVDIAQYGPVTTTPSNSARKTAQYETEEAKPGTPSETIVAPVVATMTKQFSEFDEFKMAALFVSVVVAIATLILMSNSI